MKSKKIFIYLSVIFLLSAIVLGFLANSGISKIGANWKTERTKLDEDLRSEFKNILDEKFELFLENNSQLKERLRTIVRNEDIDYVPELNSDYSYQLWQNDSLIAWNKIVDMDYSDVENFNNGEFFFFENNLYSFLALNDSINVGGVTYYYSVQQLLEKHFRFNNKYFRFVSLTDEISRELNTELKIIYRSDYNISRSGLFSDYPIKNYNGKTIGYINYPVITLDSVEKDYLDKIDLIQSVLFILAITFFLAGLFFEMLEQKNNIKWFIIAAEIFVLRIALLLFNITEKILPPSLTNPEYFSSKFAWGLAKSPMELFLTAVSVLLIISLIFRALKEFDGSRKISINKIWFLIPSVYLAALLNLLLFRSFAASVKSFIFDSNIRYFAITSLLPEFPVIFNLLNLLLVGFTILSAAFLVIQFIHRYFHLENQKIIVALSVFAAFVSYVLLDTSGIVSYFYFAVLLIAIIVLCYLYNKRNIKLFTSLIYLAILASVFSIIFLNKFDYDLTKVSLKISVSDAINGKANLYKFWLRQTLFDEAKEFEISKNEKTLPNLDYKAFLMWNQSPFMNEDIPVWVGIYDDSLKLKGGYEYLCEGRIPLQLDEADFKDEIIVKDRIQNGNTLSEGFTKFRLPDGRDFYFMIGIEYGALSYNKSIEPKFVIPSKYLDKIAVNDGNYFLAKISDAEIVDQVGVVQLSKMQAEELLSGMHAGEEYWKEFNIENNRYLIYVLKGRTISGIVGLKLKDFSAQLYHFFKIFFTHSLIIFIVALFILFNYLVGKKNLNFNFKNRLFIAFFIVSLVPILFLAVYLRDLTETKNYDTILYKLKKRADRLEKYLQANYSDEFLDFSMLEKAEVDLGIKLNLYDNNALIYSTFGKYYTTGVLSPFLNYEPFYQIVLMKNNGHLSKEKIENLEYRAYYQKLKLSGYIVEINDAFNNVLLPISIDEFDTLLFGSYAIASIMILILSTFLSNQISKPINKLTNATKAISGGDFDVSIQNEYTGEIAQLINGFNKMTKQLKKYSTDLSKLEREIAWKEMAKQVAHEIKNPLTPMKLSVQHLRAAYADKSEKFDEIFKKVTDTLINQIETLKHIATEFGNIAKMPKVEAYEINLVETIEQAVDLFLEEEIKIKISKPDGTVAVVADADHLKRSIINIIRNAIQANATEINIDIEPEESEITVRISDNGHGIAPEIQQKIFESNFTTKPDGMGIGLTLAKRFLEKVNANILLENSNSNGTSFIIKFPKIG